ncbi:hypothetical protein AB6A40_006968 [Gnathostoma spinigerum]|uniref:ATP-dependent RNA helicase n=1 Tax=Gnathostoma spinigerum TaxID=75299 RepID=A0ABD6EQ14_9BILA
MNLFFLIIIGTYCFVIVSSPLSIKIRMVKSLHKSKRKKKEANSGREVIDSVEIPTDREDREREQETDEDMDCTEAPAEGSGLYKPLGHEMFAEMKKISITSEWVNNAKKFSAEIQNDEFYELNTVKGIHPRLMEAVRGNIERWFPVQKAVLPTLIKECTNPPPLPPRDVAISAPTGSGKTLCYLLPIINSLSHSTTANIFALIITPVQSLAEQIEKEFQKYNVFDIQCVLLCGSHDYQKERSQLIDKYGHSKASVVVATPGRLVDHILDKSGSMHLTSLRYLVIDEADRISQGARLEWLDLLESVTNISGQWSTIDQLLSGNRIQTILVSATLSKDVEKLSNWRLRHPRLFRADAGYMEEMKNVPSEADHMVDSVPLPLNIEYEDLECAALYKPLALYVRAKHHKELKKILVFVNYKMTSYRLSVLLKLLSNNKFSVAELSSNLFGRRRRRVLKNFNEGDGRFLICSDAASRGIDFKNVDIVVNYDLPKTGRLFIHRAGRTARAGRSGRVLTIIDNSQLSKMKKIYEESKLRISPSHSQFSEDDVEPLREKYQTALDYLKAELNKLPKEQLEEDEEDSRSKRKRFRKKKTYICGFSVLSLLLKV